MTEIPEAGQEPLTNAKWEHFCQHVATGLTPAQAYVKSGYSSAGSFQSAGRLLRNAIIRSRIARLTSEVAHIRIEVSELNRGWILESLQKIAASGKSESARVRALELCGKELGMFVERREVTNIRTAADIPTAVLEEMREQARLEMEAEAAGKLTQMPSAAPAVEDSPVLAEAG